MRHRGSRELYRPDNGAPTLLREWALPLTAVDEDMNRHVDALAPLRAIWRRIGLSEAESTPGDTSLQGFDERVAVPSAPLRQEMMS
jgi:hypothetical protein